MPEKNSNLDYILSTGISELKLSLSAHQQQQLIDYLNLLSKWNKVYNLTSVRSLPAMLKQHILDSLSIVPYVKGNRIIDIGSGAGLPGIPLAICYPDLKVTTLDSNAKKTRFQIQVKSELKLNNLTVIDSRVETYNIEPFDQVLSRAFSSLQEMIKQSYHLCHQQGVFLAMKGQYPENELTELPAGYELKASYRLQVPDMEKERHLLILGRS